uniref:C2H2-type domain-containing protein n=1 Tax=Oncorhynchus tshawytscha TaxID=74940 RepID=A0A8C8D5V3_ONCTS
MLFVSKTTECSKLIATQLHCIMECISSPLNVVLSIVVSNLLKCEVCSAPFETRRGLSSHARSHLRQLGIGMSESSGAPIDLLYQITKERGLDGHFPPPLPRPPVAKKPLHVLPAPRIEERYQDTDMDEKPIPLSIPSPVASPPPSLIRACSPSPVVRKAPISSLLPVSSPLRCLDHKPGGVKSTTSNLSAKPFWAPQETDAPLNLTLEVDPNKDIVCQLCGAWFETRKGLSSHARAHLRHFGVEYSESKGSPIDLLNQLIHTDDFKHRASALQPEGPQGLRGLTASLSSPKRSLLTTSSTPLLYKVTTMGGGSGSKATSSSASSMFGPPSKRPKSSKLQVFRLSGGELTPIPHSECEPVKEIGCEFCGEYFENRKGLSSHARSHLRQMGITEWTVNGSPIDTLRELITRRGLPCALPLKPLKSPPPSPGPPRSPLSSPASPTVGGAAGYSSEPLNCSWSSSDNMLPLNLVTAHEVEPTRDIRCEFCGEYFENRKGLSSHARSHLRQMGITEWTVNGSPIDTLRELMHKNGVSNLSPALTDNTTPLSSLTPSPDASCELCGFYFENRKALASHARAHLRQFGVTEWCVNGSPIETLSAWMRSRPHKVVEMHRSYMQGSNRSTSKKVREELIYLHSSSSQWAALGLAQARRVGRELTLASPRAAEGDAGLTPPSRPSHSSHSPSPTRLSNTLPPHTQVARSELNVRLPRGFERRPLKHPSHSEGGDRDSGTPKPPRTGTIPALVPKPPSTPLVKVVGKIYSLRCRFCEVEFQGPLSVQEDWIRHLQQHILNLNYNKPAPSATDPPVQDHNPTPTSTSVPATTSSFTTTPAPTSTLPSIHTHTTAPTVPPPCSPSPPPMAESAPIVTATPMATASAESTLTPILIPTLSL